MSAGHRLALTWVAVGMAAAAEAQPLGTFQWQLEPYCNVLTLSVTQVGEVYRLEGTDDQCGGGRASIVGTATSNADSDIGFGLSIVTTPGAVPVHVRATISLPSISGTWQDSAGNAGAFVPTTRAATSGSPRPASGIAAAVLNPTEVQRRIRGSCAARQFITGIDQDGRVSCSPPRGGTITGVVAGPGLTASSGTTTANLSFRTFALSTSAGLVATAPPSGGGSHPIVERQGRFFAWSSGKGAFRAGEVFWYPGQWDDHATGAYSVGMGRDARAYGRHSSSFGDSSIADGQYSFALNQGYAPGMAAAAFGRGEAYGPSALAAGLETGANGPTSVALGTNVQVPYEVPGSFVFGDYRPAAASRMTGGAHQFNVRVDSFAEFVSNAAATTGVRLDVGSWQSTSDRRLKAHFRPLAGERVLARLAHLPIREWNYVTQDATIRHLGPTAQGFQAAFGLGESPRQISTVDADGIALAALRAVEARTRAVDKAHRDRRREVAELGARLDRLEGLLKGRMK